MKIDINGIIRDMTKEEVKEYQEATQHLPQELKPQLEERMEKLENFFNKLLPLLEKWGLKND